MLPPSGRFSTNRIYMDHIPMSREIKGETGRKNGKPETYFAGTWLEKRSGNRREE
jgi:hypothetical protein